MSLNTTEQRTADWYETKARIPKLKEERPSLKRVHSQVLQDVTKRVDLAYQHFFRRLKEPEVKNVSSSNEIISRTKIVGR
jgi:putative transposase